MEAEDIRLLAQIGLLAAQRPELARARAIFEALEALRPGQAFPYLIYAMALMNARRADQAIAVLDTGLRLVPGEGAADLHASRGLALRMAGRHSESIRALGQAGEHRLAKALLAESGAIPRPVVPPLRTLHT